MHLPNGKTGTVVKRIAAVLDENNLWNTIKIIVADTTNMNTGIRNGIAKQLSRLFAQKKMDEPQLRPGTSCNNG